MFSLRNSFVSGNSVADDKGGVGACGKVPRQSKCSAHSRTTKEAVKLARSEQENWSEEEVHLERKREAGSYCALKSGAF